MKFEARLNEYDGLRQEVLQVLRDMSQLRMAVISASAVLLGIAGATGKGLEGSVGRIIPFTLFVLCKTAAERMSSGRRLITRISVYIEFRIERNPEFHNHFAWERTCAAMFSNMTNEPPWRLLVREPIPWLALLMLITACVAGSYLPIWLAFGYIALHSGLFIYLLVQLFQTRWTNHLAVKEEIERILKKEGAI